MVKKILYVLCAVLLSAIVIIMCVFSFISTEGQDMIHKALKDEKYADAIGFYVGCYDERPLFHYEDPNSDMVLEVYSSISPVETTGMYNTKFNIQDNVLVFFIFNPTKELTAEDTGKLSVTLTDDSIITLPYVIKDGENVVTDYYSFTSYYKFLPNLLYEGITSHNPFDNQLKVKGIKVNQTANNTILDIVVDTPFGFDNEFHNDIRDLLIDFNTTMISVDGIEKEIQPELKAIDIRLKDLMETEHYRTPYDLGTIVSRSSFRWKTIGVISFCLIVSTGVGFFMFFKKKPTYKPLKSVTPVKKNNDVVDIPAEEQNEIDK